jgi:hypothetical protein
MSSPAFQNSAQQLNAKMEGSARLVLDEVDKKMLRTIAHSSSKCVVACFDKAGSTGSSEELDSCTRKCQIPYNQATNVVQNVRQCFAMDFRMAFWVFFPPPPSCPRYLYLYIVVLEKRSDILVLT